MNQKNFEQIVLKSNEVWMVEFFAPYVFHGVFHCSWCGHCKAMKDECHGGAVACFAVWNPGWDRLDLVTVGFPTIKVFSPIYKSPKDYQNARDAKSFCKTAFAVRSVGRM